MRDSHLFVVGGGETLRLRWTGLLIFVMTVEVAARGQLSPPVVIPSAFIGPEGQIQMPWDQPPPEFKEVEREGFHTGVEAAIHDYNHHREPDPESRKEFRNPQVQRSFREDYRRGFRRGYSDAMRHMERSSGHHS